MTKICSLDQYVNAGVSLLNLRQIKADGLDKVFIEALEEDYPFEDQDILNVYCYGRITRLPAKWNLFAVFMGQLGEMQKAGMGEDTLNAYYERKGIIHYATLACRPWRRKNCWLSEEWWNVAEEWADELEFQNIQKQVVEYEQKNKWDYYINRFSGYNQIIIFGYTKYSERLCDWIKKRKENHKVVFCDSSKEKQKLCYKGIPILSFEQIMERNPSDTVNTMLFLIASQRKAEEIHDFLNGQGIDEGDIAFYRRKDEDYYLYLDDRYYKDELKDICEREAQDWNVFCSLSLGEIQDKLRSDRTYRDWNETYYLNRWVLKE